MATFGANAEIMPTQSLPPLVLMGGTYDPVHRGHLQIALDVVELLGIDSLHLVPVHDSPSRKQPQATPQQRLAMLELAVADHPQLRVDPREVQRGGTSYTVETLESLRSEYPNRSITIVMGMDSYLSLPYWHRWQTLFDLANILVLERGTGLTPPLPKALENAVTDAHVYLANHADELLQAKNGHVLIKKCSLLNISSTITRKELAETGASSHLNPAVLNYVLDNRLYGT